MTPRNTHTLCDRRNLVLVIVGFVALVLTAGRHNHVSAADVVPSKLVKSASPGDFNKFRKILVSPHGQHAGSV